MLHKIKSCLSETYRIRNGFGLSPIRNERELKALVDFCKQQLRERKEFNQEITKSHWVYLVTIRMYEHGEVADLLFIKKYNEWQLDYYTIHQFIEEHSGHYWS